MPTAQEVLDRLKAGNQRFVNGNTSLAKTLSHQERAEILPRYGWADVGRVIRDRRLAQDRRGAEPSERPNSGRAVQLQHG